MRLSDAEILIQEIERLEYKYTPFEVGFIKNVKQRECQLSPKQAKVLQGIYTKATGGGIYIRK